MNHANGKRTEEQDEQMETDKRARMFEIGVSVALAIITSALVNTWTLSSQLQKFSSKIETHDEAFRTVGVRLDSLTTSNTSTAVTMSAMDAHYSDIVRRLDVMERNQQLLLNAVERRR